MLFSAFLNELSMARNNVPSMNSLILLAGDDREVKTGSHHIITFAMHSSNPTIFSIYFNSWQSRA
jgi:hypothetical protein